MTTEPQRAMLAAARRYEALSRKTWLEALEGRRRAIRASREAGMTYDQIAAELGVTRKAVIDQARRGQRCWPSSSTTPTGG